MEKTCFVIMGFGIKTDFRTGRDINLDKTYNNIVKPAFEELGFLCFRADDIKHSGVIDIPMYENILKADFVIADISTLNPNVLYELGVRHAVRKSTTLIIAEKELPYPFDLNHILIDSYEHLGKAIDYDEVVRFKTHLKEKVAHLLMHPSTDSPLYSLFPTLVAPTFTEREIEEIKENIEEEKSPADLVQHAEYFRANNEYEKAISLLNEARVLLPRNDFIIQRLVLATYKSKIPNEGSALFAAEQLLSALNPEKTTDPETLGLAGAINKRLFEVYNDREYLEKSIWYYSRGFYVRQDYYNGINLAFLHTLNAALAEEMFSSYASFGDAMKIRKQVIDICLSLESEETFKNRDDKAWIYLTLAEAYFGLDDITTSEKYHDKAIELSAEAFQLSSYSEQLTKIQRANATFHEKWKI